jgi:ribulose-5-phosphate 4-epimerase/fuculose-1-phosphate aldolase
MHGEKGYVQFLCDWERADPPTGPMLDDLRLWRDQLYLLGMIGVYPEGIGFGNLSCRPGPGNEFVITGTATGALPTLGPEHLTEVLECDIARNWLRCRGPMQASSESLSHAAIYRSCPQARAVIHVHHFKLWERLFGKAPTTDPCAEAGTPAMAEAIAGLFRAGPVGLFVMGGHREGIMVVGSNLDEAGTRLLSALEQSELK